MVFLDASESSLLLLRFFRSMGFLFYLLILMSQGHADCDLKPRPVLVNATGAASSSCYGARIQGLCGPSVEFLDLGPSPESPEVDLCRSLYLANN